MEVSLCSFLRAGMSLGAGVRCRWVPLSPCERSALCLRGCLLVCLCLFACVFARSFGSLVCLFVSVCGWGVFVRLFVCLFVCARLLRPRARVVLVDRLLLAALHDGRREHSHAPPRLCRGTHAVSTRCPRGRSAGTLGRTLRGTKRGTQPVLDALLYGVLLGYSRVLSRVP